MNLSMTISGTSDVIRELDSIKESVQRRLIERAARFALRPVVTDARKNIPVNTGTLRRSIGVKKSKRSRSGELVLSVGPRPGYAYEENGVKRNPFFYGIPVEYGHVTRGGSFVAPAAFLRGAYERNKDSAVLSFSVRLSALIEKYKEA